MEAEIALGDLRALAVEAVASPAISLGEMGSGVASSPLRLAPDLLAFRGRSPSRVVLFDLAQGMVEAFRQAWDARSRP